MKYFFRLLSNSWIKDHIGTIVLIPTLLGGLWQIIELSSISIPFIRFFSVSQLVADGLLLLFILCFIYISWRLLPNALRDDQAQDDENGQEDNDAEAGENASVSRGIFKPATQGSRFNKRHGFLMAGGLLLIFVFIFGWAWWPDVMMPIINKERLNIMTIIGLVTGPVIGWTILTVALRTILEIYNIELNRDNKVVEDIIKIFYVLVFGVSMYIFFPFIRLFHRSYLLPENFKNVEYIECKVRAHNSKLKSFAIEYFNDKYIFINVKDSTNKSSIEVFKFEDFLESSACDPK